MPRLLAIGDVHGCAGVLEALLEMVQPAADDTLVFLGDLVDRGPDVPGVVATVRGLGDVCERILLRGNHEQAMLDARAGVAELSWWRMIGGDATLMAYEAARVEEIPDGDIEFLSDLPLVHVEEDFFFIHGGYDPARPLEAQDPDVAMWKRLEGRPWAPHASGKTAVVGHSIQFDYRVLCTEALVCIDTGCFAGGWLTCLEPGTGRLWQADMAGQTRETSVEDPQAAKRGP